MQKKVKTSFPWGCNMLICETMQSFMKQEENKMTLAKAS